MIKKIGIILLVLLFLITGCNEKEVVNVKGPTFISKDTNGIDLKNINQYNMDILFSPKEKRIKAHQQVDFINHEKVPLTEIYFHLYPNSFKNQKDAPYLFEDFESTYPKGFKPGSIEIKNLVVNGKKVNYTLEGQGKTIMKVPLSRKILPKEKLTINMDYIVQLPPAQDRFGYGDDFFNMGNWYPILAVYDKTGWNLDPYYPIGDPFYSDVSNYSVKIQTPKDFIIASSGNILEDQVKGNKRNWKIEGKLIRDFAWVASNQFEVIERNVDGTTLKMYFQRGVEKPIKEWAAMASRDSLKVFNDVYGKYPYGQYSVVQTNFSTGMEYPGIVFIGKDMYKEGLEDYLEIVIVHETAHQWWYGVVGNDEIDEAWLDESFAAYSEVIYNKELFGEKEGKDYHKMANEDAYREAASSIGDEVILKPLKKFMDWNDYGILAYSKGAMFLNDLYNRYGKEKFYKIMKIYYQRYQFKNATTEDFQSVCEEVTGDNLDNLFDYWLLDQE